MTSPSSSSTMNVLTLDSESDKAYINQLTMFSMTRLEKEPRVLSQQIHRINKDMTDLTVNNYRTFVQSSHCVQSVGNAIDSIDDKLDTMSKHLIEFTKRCQDYTQTSKRLRHTQRLNRLMLDNQMQLLELLELPQLMDNCSRAQLYDQALDLYDYALSLKQRHANINILSDIVNEMHQSLYMIREQLLSVLQTEMQLPMCLRAIGYLRRINVYNERELRVQFLQCRSVWVSKLLREIELIESPYEYVTKFLEAYRVALFEIITQYRAIFVDDSSAVDDNMHDDDDTNTQNIDGLLYYWIYQQLMIILDTLRNTLNRITEGTFIINIMEQCMYCGLSLSRVGLDFRCLLPPLFEDRVVALFTENIGRALDDFSDSLTRYSWCLNHNDIAKYGISHIHDISLKHVRVKTYSNPPELKSLDEISARILQHAPLAAILNHYITAINQLRQCAPLSIRFRVIRVVDNVLIHLANRLQSFRRLTYDDDDNNNHDDDDDETNEHMRVLVQCLVEYVVPYMNYWLVAIFCKPKEEEKTTTTTIPMLLNLKFILSLRGLYVKNVDLLTPAKEPPPRNDPDEKQSTPPLSLTIESKSMQ